MRTQERIAARAGPLTPGTDRPTTSKVGAANQVHSDTVASEPGAANSESPGPPLSSGRDSDRSQRCYAPDAASPSRAVRVKVRCVTPLGDDTASMS